MIRFLKSCFASFSNFLSQRGENLHLGKIVTLTSPLILLSRSSGKSWPAGYPMLIIDEISSYDWEKTPYNATTGWWRPGEGVNLCILIDGFIVFANIKKNEIKPLI